MLHSLIKDILQHSIFVLYFLLASLICSTSASAEEALLGFGTAAFTQEMQTDRPDFTEGAQTVQPGHIQLEAGYTYSKFSSSGSSSEAHSIPEALLRIGLLDDFELRIFWEGYLEERERSSGANNKQNGISDFSLGFKNRIILQDEYLPAVSALFEIGLPTGSSEVSATEVIPAMKLLLEKDFGHGLAVASNLNLSVIPEDGDEFVEYSHSLTLGVDVGRGVGSYLEYYGFIPENGQGREDSHFIAGGATYAVTPDLQLDIRSIFGLNDDSDDFQAGLGFSMRL